MREQSYAQIAQILLPVRCIAAKQKAYKLYTLSQYVEKEGWKKIAKSKRLENPTLALCSQGVQCKSHRHAYGPAPYLEQESV